MMQNHPEKANRKKEWVDVVLTCCVQEYTIVHVPMFSKYMFPLSLLFLVDFRKRRPDIRKQMTKKHFSLCLKF